MIPGIELPTHINGHQVRRITLDCDPGEGNDIHGVVLCLHTNYGQPYEYIVWGVAWRPGDGWRAYHGGYHHVGTGSPPDVAAAHKAALDDYRQRANRL